MADCIIFDVDGTLVDSVDLHARAWHAALEHFGVQVPLLQVRSQIGKGSDQLLPTLVPAERLPEIEEPLKRFRSDLYRREYLPQVVAFPEVRTLFEDAAGAREAGGAGVSAKERELQDYKRIAQIEDLVDAETHADDVERSKPHPDVFQAVIQALGGPSPATCVVVGDSPYDAEAAARASIRSVAMLCGGFPRKDLEHAGYSAFFRDPADLLRHFRNDPRGTLG